MLGTSRNLRNHPGLTSARRFKRRADVKPVESGRLRCLACEPYSPTRRARGGQRRCGIKNNFQPVVNNRTQDGQQTIADRPSGTAAGSAAYTYVYASYIDEPLMRGGSGGLRYYHRNQQYSITAVSDGGGAVVERYAYSAYGQVTIADASGSAISNSAIANRYTYTGREWDEGLSLYHYRARMYDSLSGRFVSRDPIGYVDAESLYGDYFGNQHTDPYGLSKHHWFPQSLQNELGKKCKEALQKLGVSATEFSNFFTSELGPWIGGELHVEVQNRDPRGTWNSHVKKILDDDSRTCCDAIQDIVASIPDWLKAAQDRLNMPSTGGMPELVPWRGPGQTGENFLRYLTDSICKPPPRRALHLVRPWCLVGFQCIDHIHLVQFY